MIYEVLCKNIISTDKVFITIMDFYGVRILLAKFIKKEHQREYYDTRINKENSYYWDARVKSLDCNYFGDEVKLVFEDDKKDITYHFEECYKVKIEHAVESPKDIASKEFALTQIPYFLQDVELNEIKIIDKKYMEFRINMHPIELLIVCNKFNIYQSAGIKGNNPLVSTKNLIARAVFDTSCDIFVSNVVNTGAEKTIDFR